MGEIRRPWKKQGVTDNDDREKEMAGMVRTHEQKRSNRTHQSSCRNEDGRKTL